KGAEQSPPAPASSPKEAEHSQGDAPSQQPPVPAQSASPAPVAAAEPAIVEPAPAKQASPPPAAEASPAAPSAPVSVQRVASPPPPAADAIRPKANSNNVVVARTYQSGDKLRIELPFAVPTPAAVFQRADTLWLVFDTAAPIDLTALQADNDNGVREIL